MDNNVFIQELNKKGCISINKGKFSVDLKIIIGYPNLLNYVCDKFYKEARTISFDAIIGMSYFGIVHASYLSSRLNKPLCIIKNEKKVQRELLDPASILNIINNDDETSINFIIVVDSIEKGFRLSTFIHSVKTRIKNCNIQAIFTICDNCIATNKHLTLSNYYIYNIINSHDIINNLLEHTNINNEDFLKLYNTMNFTNNIRDVFKIQKRSLERIQNIIKSKQTNLFVSLYFTNFFHIVNTVNKLSQYICGIFINSEIIENYSKEKALLLKKLAKEQNIIVVNNVQFTLGNKIVNNTILKNHFNYYDIVTLKINTAEEISMFNEFSLDLLKNIHDNYGSFIFIMKGGGYNNHFINQKIFDLCSKYENIIAGILVNKREYYMRNDNYLYFTDDIEAIDKTPQVSILNDKCDLIVYGISEFNNLTKEYLDNLLVNVKYYHSISWAPFKKINQLEN